MDVSAPAVSFLIWTLTRLSAAAFVRLIKADLGQKFPVSRRSTPAHIFQRQTTPPTTITAPLLNRPQRAHSSLFDFQDLGNYG